MDANTNERPSRRRALSVLAASVPAIATASLVNAGSAAIDGRSEYSPKIAAAFAKWQALVRLYNQAEAALNTAYDKYAAIKPAIPDELLTGRAAKFCANGGINVIGIEREAARYPLDAALVQAAEIARRRQSAIDAAVEQLELTALDDAASEASSAEGDEFLVFLSVPPETPADVRLQAKHLKEWLHASSNERPVETWLEALTGTTWPDDAADNASDVEVAHV